jgi:hypothetical protein
MSVSTRAQFFTTAKKVRFSGMNQKYFEIQNAKCSTILPTRCQGTGLPVDIVKRRFIIASSPFTVWRQIMSGPKSSIENLAAMAAAAAAVVHDKRKKAQAVVVKNFPVPSPWAFSGRQVGIYNGPSRNPWR